MTAPKKKPAAKKPAAKKADPAKGPAKDPVVDPTKQPTEPKAEPPKSKVPNYLTNRVLSDEDRVKLIRMFNVEFDALFPDKVKDPKTLETMQNRIKGKKAKKG